MSDKEETFEYEIDLSKFPDGVTCTRCGERFTPSVPITFICTNEGCPLYTLQNTK